MRHTYYAAKFHLKETTDIDASKFAKKVDLAHLNSDADLDIDQLKNFPVDLSKLSDIVKNEVVKNIIYDKLVKNVYDIQNNDTIDLVKNTELKDTKIVVIEKKF